MAKLKRIGNSHFNCMFNLRGLKFTHILSRNSFEWVFIFRQGWQWSWPESTLLSPLRATVYRVTTFEVSIKGFLSLSLTYMLSSSVLKCSCTVQMIALSVRKSASQHEMQGGLFSVLGHLVVSLTRWERENMRKTGAKGHYSMKQGAETHNWGSGVKVTFRLWIALPLHYVRLPKRHIKTFMRHLRRS